MVDALVRLRTHAPSTYKIPLASDRLKIFNVRWTGIGRRPMSRPSIVPRPWRAVPLPLGPGASAIVGCRRQRCRSPDLSAPLMRRPRRNVC